METPLIQTTLEDRIRDLLHLSLRAHNIRDDDAVSLKTLKLMLIGKVLECYGLDWSYLMNLFKTQTPVHPDMIRELQLNEELNNLFDQIFVRNDKLLRLMKALAQTGRNVNQMLAVDGLGGPSGLNFDQKHYIENLRYGSNGGTPFFDKGPECKRLHVQTVRSMYDMLGNVPVPEKHIYEILKDCFESTTTAKFPKLEFQRHELIDRELQEEAARFYMSEMGPENIQMLVKSLRRFRGEKRHAAEQQKGEKKQDTS